MTGPEAHQKARHMARYSHKCWIAWKERDGSYSAALESPESVKRAMLAVGTQGRWTAFNGVHGHVQRWWMGIIFIRNARVWARAA